MRSPLERFSATVQSLAAELWQKAVALSRGHRPAAQPPQLPGIGAGCGSSKQPGAGRDDAGEALRESEARLRLALDAAELGIWRWDVGADNGHMRWDARCKALFGVSPAAEVTYEVWANSIPPEDRVKCEADVARALDPADPRDETRCEYRVRQRDGTIRWVSSIGRAFFDAGPAAPSGRRPRFMTGAIRDVTEAHLAEAARREWERHDRYFLELDKRLREAITARDAIDTACEALGQELGASFTGFGELQADGEHTLVESAWSAGDLPPPSGQYRLTDCGEKQLAALLTGEAVIVADVLTSPYTKEDETAKAVYAAHGARSSIVAAFLRNGPRALLFVACAAPRAWTEAEVALARGTLDRAWHAVERARAEGALRDSEERFREIANLAPVLIWMSGSTGGCTWFNRPWLDFTGRPMEQQLGDGWAEGVHPDDLERCLATYNTAFERREPFRMDYRLKRHDGTWRIVNDIGAQRYSRDGAFLGYIGSCLDVTEQREAEAALRESEERFRLAVDAADAGTWEAIQGTGEFLACGRARELFGLPPGVPSSFETVLSAIHPEDRPRVENALTSKMETGTRFNLEFRVPLPDGAARWVEVHAEFRLDREVPKYAGLILDITERKRASDHIHMLMREVNHRSKNMLTLVQAVARQTVASSPDDFLDRFAERIEALAASQDLLVRNEWKGVRLDQLGRSQLAHFADLIGTRVRINGHPLLIEASAAQAIGMALHELATNAGKYGALSNDSGHVTIEWGLEQADGQEVNFILTWQEHGGPPVTAAVKRGFGSTVITEMAEMSLYAKVDLDFAVTGLTWRLQCNAKEVLQGGAPDAECANAALLCAPRPGMRSRILVVEDEPLVAIEIAHILKAAGFDVVGPARAVAQALSLIGERGCDAAVLDINLGGETSEPVAGHLLRRGTPFITLSGYSRMQHPPVFSSVPALAKPLQPDLLVTELRRCLQREQKAAR